MTSTTRRTLLDVGIALDVAVIAIGIAALANRELLHDPQRLLLFTFAALFVGAAIALARRSPAERRRPVGWNSDVSSLLINVSSTVALPILALVIYTNFSDLSMRAFGIPSVLQPLIVLLGVVTWYYRRELDSATIVAQPLTFALLAYTAVLFISSVWAADVRLADDRVVDTIKNVALFVIAASLASSWRAIQRVILVLTIAASALSILSSYQTLAHDYTNEFLGFARIQIATLYAGVSELRPAGPVGDPNFYAQILLMIVPLALFAAFAEERPRIRATLFTGGAIITIGVALTYSRGAMLALGVMTLLALLILRPTSKQLTAIGATAVIAFIALPNEVTQRLLTIEALMPGTEQRADASILKRRLLLGTAARMFDDHLVAGVGAGNFTKHYAHYANAVGSAAPQYEQPGERQFPHTLYLEIGAETGIIGLATFAIAMTCAFVALIKMRRTLLDRDDVAHAGIVAGLMIALSGYLITSLFLHGSYQRYLFLLLALCATTTRLAEQRA